MSDSVDIEVGIITFSTVWASVWAILHYGQVWGDVTALPTPYDVLAMGFAILAFTIGAAIVVVGTVIAVIVIVYILFALAVTILTLFD